MKYYYMVGNDFHDRKLSIRYYIIYNSKLITVIFLLNLYYMSSRIYKDIIEFKINTLYVY